MSMPSFQWLPIGTLISDEYRTLGLLAEGDAFQLLSLTPGDRVVLVMSLASPLAAFWTPLLQPMLYTGRVTRLDMGNDRYYTWILDKSTAPIKVRDIPQQNGLMKGRDLAALARALRGLPDCHWGEALYLPGEHLCVPMQLNAESAVERRQLVVRLLTGGVGDAAMSPENIRLYNAWLTLADIHELMRGFGVLDPQAGAEHDTKTLGHFKLPGRPELEQFFNDYIVDYYRERSRYEEMAVLPPNGVLLYGPPGTGKSYAARQLAKFLGWPVRTIDLGSVGSPYIHQTGLRLRQEFELAAQEAPSLIIMDEIDAMGASRNALEHNTQVEEMAELLRLLETSAEKNVLVVATTNRLEAMDPALLRKGRFDYQLHIDYATRDEIQAVLSKALNQRKVSPSLDLSAYASALHERPLSDVAWLVNEASRLAVRHQRHEIDGWCLDQALSRLA